MQELVELFKALGDESRLRIYALLVRAGELCVCDIERTLGFTQPKVSRHLAYLKRYGLVRDRKQGLWMIYSAVPPEEEGAARVSTAVREMIRQSTVATEDVERLKASIAGGCCVTSTLFGWPSEEIEFELESS